MPSPPKKKFSSPLDFSVYDESDLLRVPVALDEVATLIATHPRLRDVPDIESEPLDSLIRRAEALLDPDDPDESISELVERAMEAVAELEEEARQVRYGGGDEVTFDKVDDCLRELEEALEELEKRLDA